MAIAYYENLLGSPVRILDITIPPHGAISVPVEKAQEPKFSAAIDVLVGKIDKKRYDEKMEEQKQEHNILKRRDLPKITTVIQDNTSPKGYIEIEEVVGTDPHPSELKKFQEYAKKLMEEGVQTEIDVSGYAGAEWGLGPAPRLEK